MGCGMAEKRFFVRIQSNMDCTCTFHNEKIKGVIKDFSSDGMRIYINADVPYDFNIGDSVRVKYATQLEGDSMMAPIVIKCNVIVRNMQVGSSDEYYYTYQLGCQIENSIDTLS